MTNKKLTLLFLFFSLPPVLYAAEPAKDSTGGMLSYVGESTRLGIGYDTKTKLRGELYYLIKEDQTTAWIFEGWVSGRHRGTAAGLKLNYHWLPEKNNEGFFGAGARKLFAAVDQNQFDDRKATVGFGVEKERYFWAGYLSRSLTGRREVSDITTSATQTIRGSEGGRDFLQDITTSTRTRIFERPYDYGAGVRLGHFHDPALVRLTTGLDYERGKESARQLTFSLGVEKFFYNSPHSIGLYGEVLRKSGGFETERNDRRLTVMYRYELGTRSYREAKPYRTVEVPAAAPTVVAPPPVSAATAETKPRTEKRLIKVSAAMSSEAFFDFDSARLRDSAVASLNSIIETLKKSGYTGNIKLTGHTCDIGTAAYNQNLSERRAASVKEYLISRGSIPANAIIAEGKGESQPRYPNTKAERPKNRRVDLEFVTYQDKLEDVVLPAEPAKPSTGEAAKPTIPAVEWKKEYIEVEPTWVRRALHNTIRHKQTVDVYRTKEESTTVTPGPQRFLNRAPIAMDDSFEVNAGSANNLFDVLANDRDPDNDPLRIASVTTPTRGTAVISGNRVAYTPNAGFSGEDSFSYTISDDRGGSASATVRVSVRALNRAPIANDDVTFTLATRPVTIDVLANDSDPDGDRLTVTSVTDPPNGTARILADGTILYQADPGFCGTDSFRYTISDGRGGTATATVTVEVFD